MSSHEPVRAQNATDCRIPSNPHEAIESLRQERDNLRKELELVDRLLTDVGKAADHYREALEWIVREGAANCDGDKIAREALRNPTTSGVDCGIPPEDAPMACPACRRDVPWAEVEHESHSGIAYHTVCRTDLESRVSGRATAVTDGELHG